MRILANDGLDKKAVKALESLEHELIQEHFDLDELKEKIKEIDVIIIRSSTKIRRELIDEASKSGRLKLIIRAGVGLDNIDVDYATNKNITVKNTPNSSSRSVAELVLGQMISLARFTYLANITMKNEEWNKKQYKGSELMDKNLGIIGFGRISKEVAKIASAIGMKILYTNRSGAKEGYTHYQYKSLEDLLKESDFITIHVPFNREIGPILGTNEFDIIKDGAFLINCARGGVVDEKALVKALNSGKISAAAIDVFEEEPTKNMNLINHPKTTLTPHIGGATKEAQARIGEEVVSVIKNFF